MKTPDYLTLYFDAEPSAEPVAEPAAETGTLAQKGGKTAAKGSNAAAEPAADDRDTPRYSDNDLDKIIERKFAKWQRQQADAVSEATRLANMTAQERAEHERDKFKSELDALKHTILIGDMERTARGILQADGVNVPDSIISTIIGEDAETTSANVKAFSKAFKKAVHDEVKRVLTHKTPTVGSGSGMTKEQIMGIKDPLKKQQAIRDNRHLFINK